MRNYLFIITFLPIIISFPPILEFQFDIFNKLLQKNPNNNIVISPISIFEILSLVSNGAVGKTQLEILKTLKSKTVIDLNKYLEKINKILLSKQESSIIYIANAIFSKVQIKKEFRDISNRYFAYISPLISHTQINEWVEKNTNNKIKNMIESIENIQLLLINAIYFKSDWLIKFRKEFTEEGIFNNKDKVLYMNNLFTLNEYYEDENVQITSLYYSSNKLKAIIALEKEGKKFNINKINDYIKKFKHKGLKLILPKFKIEYNIDLIEILREMGMKISFTQMANFNNLSENSDLFINEIKHKSFLEVNEDGTEAASSTAIAMDNGIVVNYYTMNVNKPFFFGIMHQDIQDTFIFMSKINSINNF